MNKLTARNKKDVWKIIGLIAIGILIGMILSWIFVFISVNSFVNNILPKIQIENINFDLNETALVDAMNNSFLPQLNKHPESDYWINAQNFTCFGMTCSPVDAEYIEGIGICYKQKEGLICPA
jgi:hypothetical protein